MTGTLNEPPLDPSPHVNFLYDPVSCLPVNLLSLFDPYKSRTSACVESNLGMISLMIYSYPPASLVLLFEKFVCAPDPFQSPWIGLGS